MRTNNCFALITMLSGIATITLAQSPVKSPEVNADNTVTFRFLAPKASDVKLSVQFERGQVPMTKDTSGLWTVKVGPAKPDMYPYCFIVDGIPVADPRNTAIFPNEGFQNSVVEITGASPLIHTIQNVPHGTLSYRYYNSPELGTRPVVIYMDEKKIKHETFITDGGHTWMNCKLFLATIAQKLFK